MKEQILISELIKDVKFEGFLLVKQAQQRAAQTGTKYLDMTLVDVSGEINAKMWDPLELPPAAGSVVKVRALVNEYNNHLQLRIDKMRAAVDEDGVDMEVLVPCAPRPGDEMMEEILSRTNEIENEQLRAIVFKRLDEAGDRLLFAPGAKSMHHAQRSGLLYHTCSMLKTAECICSVYKYLDADLLAAGVILHDLCKIEEFVCDELGLATDYSTEGNLVGHIVMGVAQLDRCGKELGTDPELLMMLEHMLLSHHNLPEFGSPKPPMFPEAEVLHMVDDLDAKLFEMRSELEKVKPGCFSDFFKPLERKLYRRSEG